MKRLSNRLFLLIFLLLSQVAWYTLSSQEIKSFLEHQPGIKQIRLLDQDTLFKEVYEVMLKQPVDHEDTSKGWFLQRVIVSHLDTTRPVVIVLEGYAGFYAARSSYREELSRLLGTNQIFIEHRYFGKSVPTPLNWDYLTVANAAADDHAVISLFKQLYKGKWISTGVSKGGQTTLFHRSLYPNDVDVSVPYVAPLNFSVEDPRPLELIDRAGPPDKRKQVRDFQLEILKRRDRIYPIFLSYVQEKKYVFRIPVEEVYDYCVLEYPFAFWQYGISPAEIPIQGSADSTCLKHLVKVSSPEYFSLQGMAFFMPFYVQAARELGYYSYNTKPFEPYLKVKSTKGYLNRVFLPDSLSIAYQPKTMKAVQKFLHKNDPKMIFLYGEFDPWAGSAVEFGKKQNMMKVVKPGGSHATRIRNLPEEQKQMVIRKLQEWMESGN